MSEPSMTHARRCVEWFRGAGLCVLPSRMDRKGPALDRYAAHFGPVPVPECVYERWATTNMQLITGTKSPTKTKILVIDCDGERSREVWAAMLDRNHDTAEGTWQVTTGGGGLHTYYRIPHDEQECPSGLLWGVWDTWGKQGTGSWLPHQELRILGDRSLAVSPPSLHIPTGKAYQYTLNGNPKQIGLPRFAPRWLLNAQRLTTPNLNPQTMVKKPSVDPMKKYGNNYSSGSVLDAVADKYAVAQQWGVVFTSGPNTAGWAKCYVPGRETPGLSRASGSFNVSSGRLMDNRDRSTCSFFDLGVLTGRYFDWASCRNDLGDQYGC